MLIFRELALSQATHDKHLMCTLLLAKNLVLSPPSSFQWVLTSKVWEPAVSSLLLPLNPCAGGWAQPMALPQFVFAFKEAAPLPSRVFLGSGTFF